MIKRSVRKKVYDRDGWRCWYCGKDLTQFTTSHNANAPTLDHIIPKALYPDNCQDNLRTCCKSCNVEKADLDLEEYRWFLTLKASEAARNYYLLDELVFDSESSCVSHYYLEIAPEINEVREMRDAFSGQFTLHRFFGEMQ